MAKPGGEAPVFGIIKTHQKDWGLNGLLKWDERGEAKHIPQTFDQIQAALERATNYRLPLQLSERFGLSDSTPFTLIAHPESTSTLWLRDNKTVSIEIERKTDDGTIGQPEYEFFPVAVHIAGFDLPLHRPVAVKYYRNEWHPQIDPKTPMAVHKIQVGLTGEEDHDGPIKNDYAIPTRRIGAWRNWYVEALITPEMIPVVDGKPLFESVANFEVLDLNTYRTVFSIQGKYITHVTDSLVEVGFAPEPNLVDTLPAWKFQAPKQLDKVR